MLIHLYRNTQVILLCEAFVHVSTEVSYYLFVNSFLPPGCKQLQKWNWLHKKAPSADSAAPADDDCYTSCCSGDCCWTIHIFLSVNQQFVGREGKFHFNVCCDSCGLVELIFQLFAFIYNGYQVPAQRQPALPSLVGPRGQSIPSTGK